MQGQSREKRWGGIARATGWVAVLASLTAAAAPLPAFAESEDRFAGFVSPVSNPVNFEDPRARTEIRPLYVYHKISDQFGEDLGLGRIGGDAHIVAVQIRAAVTDRLSIIATKDGYVWLRPDDVLVKEDGWANLAFGLKYAFFRDADLGAMATAGLRYEAPSGNTDVFQGQHPVIPEQVDPSSPLAHEKHGKGVMNPFVSALWGRDDLGPGDLHLMTYGGFRIPISGYDSTFFDMSLHADYGFDLGDFGSVLPLFEVNWIQVLDGGRRLPIDQEGFDFFNLGTTKSGGHGVVTAAFGARYRLFEGVGDILGQSLGAELGAAYEFPMTDREDLFGWRVTTDIIFFLM